MLYFHSRIWASYYKATINKRQKGNKIEQMDFFHETLNFMQIHTHEEIRPIIIPLQSSSSGIWSIWAQQILRIFEILELVYNIFEKVIAERLYKNLRLAEILNCLIFSSYLISILVGRIKSLSGEIACIFNYRYAYLLLAYLKRFLVVYTIIKTTF